MSSSTIIGNPCPVIATVGFKASNFITEFQAPDQQCTYTIFLKKQKKIFKTDSIN
ncbi:hypothetical protein ACIQXF_02920 [Lysinibacillus sp. NPDC097231]|uniref:hypothetical protein n=1 Tax=Lysinibacillus sp. NPDC097231 TaxID=3364142 RepID=UPI003805F1D8